MSVPTVAQMLTVIGVALLAVVVLVTGVSALLDWLTQRTASAVNNTPALSGRAPIHSPATLPAQRTDAQAGRTEPARAAHHQHAA